MLKALYEKTVANMQSGGLPPRLSAVFHLTRWLCGVGLSMTLSYLIKNASLVDGSGKPPMPADIAIQGEKIAAIGQLSDANASAIIDAKGAIVCPGFIDVHSHSDTYILIEPSAPSKLYQGITSEICGNCGASAAPLMGEYRMPSDWIDKEYPGPWSTVSEYREQLDAASPAINIGLLIGHNTLHAGVCGYDAREATPEELSHMQVCLEQALEEGGLGLSSGLIYPPGSAVPESEIIELVRTVARHGGLYTTHMRSESSQLLEAINEAIRIAEQAEARLQISHLKTARPESWHKLPEALEKIEIARQRIPFGSDRYPYTAACTDLDIVLPDWAAHGGREIVLARLRDHATRQQIREELQQSPESRWEQIMIGSTTDEHLKGAYLLDAARELDMDPADTLLHLIDKDDLKTGGIFFGMSEENMWKILSEPYVSIGSDASLRAPSGPLSKDHPHPRAYGSFTRFLRAALDGKTVGLPEAIRKMTSLPAEQFSLPKRGLLKEGYFADLLIFSPDLIKENTDYKDPHHLSEGMQHIFVNGVHSMQNGLITHARGGRFLDHSS